MSEALLRFVLGGAVVSVFAILADVLRPKSFAGLFGAAPSVALASLGLAVANHGADYAAVEATSMVAGAVALGVYSLSVCYLLMVRRWHALAATIFCLLVWLAVAFGLLGLGGALT